MTKSRAVSSNLLAAGFLIIVSVVVERLFAGDGGSALPLEGVENRAIKKQLPAVSEQKLSRMTEDELKRAAPQSDKDGARWKAQIPEFFERNFVPGRECPLTITSNCVMVPFDNYVLARDLKDGLFGIDQVPFLGKVTQTAFGIKGCVFAVDDRRHELNFKSSLSSNAKGEPVQYQHTLTGHTVLPWQMKFSVQGTRLISCSDDGSMILWNVETGKKVNKFPCFGYGGNGSTARGEFAGFSTDGKWLATVAPDGPISLRDPLDGTEKVSWALSGSALRFAHNNNSMFVFGLVNRYSKKKKKETVFQQIAVGIENDYAMRYESIHSAEDGIVSPDDKHLITWDGLSAHVNIWDISKHQEVALLNVDKEVLCDLALSPRGTVLATAGGDGEIKFWSMKTFKQLSTKRRFKHQHVNYVRFSPDGKYLITASGDDGWLKVWDAPESAVTSNKQWPQAVHMSVSEHGITRILYDDGFVLYRKANLTTSSGSEIDR